MDQLKKLYYAEAVTSFKKVVEIDSSFALSYFQLAYTLSLLSRPADVYFQEALQYSHRSTMQEQARIRAEEARFSNNAAEYFRRMEDYLTVYHDDKHAHLRLGEEYARHNEFQKSILQL